MPAITNTPAYTVAEVFPEYIGKENRIALRAYRTRENLTQKQLAALTGIPQHHISEMENGKRPHRQGAGAQAGGGAACGGLAGVCELAGRFGRKAGGAALQNLGKTTRIYTQSMEKQFEKDLWQLKGEHGI